MIYAVFGIVVGCLVIAGIWLISHVSNCANKKEDLESMDCHAARCLIIGILIGAIGIGAMIIGPAMQKRSGGVPLSDLSSVKTCRIVSIQQVADNPEESIVGIRKTGDTRFWVRTWTPNNGVSMRLRTFRVATISVATLRDIKLPANCKVNHVGNMAIFIPDKPNKK